MRDEFAFLSVLVSIILGFGLAHLLGGFARAIHNRERSAMYWPSILWAVTLFLIIIQNWWSDFALRNHTNWTFAAFLTTLLIPCALYVLCSLILPVDRDMRENYYENRVWFFALLIALPILSAIQQIVIDGHIHADADTAFKAFGIGLGILGIAVKAEAFQKVWAIVGAAFILYYVGALFSTLPGS